MYATGELKGEMIKPPSTSTLTKMKHSYRWFPYIFQDEQYYLAVD
jgi:hypothetical protein